MPAKKGLRPFLITSTAIIGGAAIIAPSVSSVVSGEVQTDTRAYLELKDHESSLEARKEFYTSKAFDLIKVIDLEWSQNKNDEHLQLREDLLELIEEKINSVFVENRKEYNESVFTNARELIEAARKELCTKRCPQSRTEINKVAASVNFTFVGTPAEIDKKITLDNVEDYLMIENQDKLIDTKVKYGHVKEIKKDDKEIIVLVIYQVIRGNEVSDWKKAEVAGSAGGTEVFPSPSPVPELKPITPITPSPGTQPINPGPGHQPTKINFDEIAKKAIINYPNKSNVIIDELTKQIVIDNTMITNIDGATYKVTNYKKISNTEIEVTYTLWKDNQSKEGFVAKINGFKEKTTKPTPPNPNTPPTPGGDDRLNIKKEYYDPEINPPYFLDRKPYKKTTIEWRNIYHGTLQYDASNNYYASLNGLKGQELFNAVFNLQNKYRNNVKSYDSLKSLYLTTFNDKYFDEDGKETLIDLYTENPDGKDHAKYWGTNMSSGFNREHLVPQSWFNKNSKTRCDAHFVWPADASINSARGNGSYFWVPKPKRTTANGTKLFGNQQCEPIDLFKGDVARAFLYFQITWRNGMSANGTDVFTSSFPFFTEKYLQCYREWNKLDAVDLFEIDHNNAFARHQGKLRNPFIDYPELVELIWGKTNKTFENRGVLVGIKR